MVWHNHIFCDQHMTGNLRIGLHWLLVVHVFGAVQLAVRVPVKPVPHVPVHAALNAVGLLQPVNAPLAGLVGLLVHSAGWRTRTGVVRTTARPVRP